MNDSKRSRAALGGPQVVRRLREILGGRQAEETSVFPAELVGAFIADHESDGGGIALSGDQQRAGMKKADPLLELQRAQRRDRLEVAVKRRDTQGSHLGQCLHLDLRGKIAPDPVDRNADARQRGVRRGDIAQHPSKRPLQHPEQDFPLVDGRKNRDLVGMIEKPHHAEPGIEKLGRDRSDGKSGIEQFSAGRLGDLGKKICEDFRIKRQLDGEIRFSRRRRVDRACRGKIDRHDKVGCRIIFKCPVANSHSLSAREDQIDHRLVDGGKLVLGDLALDHGDAGNARLSDPVVGSGRQFSKFAQLLFHDRTLSDATLPCKG